MAPAGPDGARLTDACHGTPETASVGLASALRALANAGLSDDALRLATAALLGAGAASPRPAARVDGA